MMKQFILAAIAMLTLLLPIVYAEGPMYCDVLGNVLNPDGSHAANNINVLVSIQNTLGEASGATFTHSVLTKTGPPSTFSQGSYFTSYAQGEDCNFGEPVTIEVTFGDLYGKTTSVLTENPAKGQYDIILGKQPSTASGGNNGAEGSSAPVAVGSAVVSDNLVCEISGFVKDAKTLSGENSIPVTVILQDTKGKATSESIPVQTETKYSPVGGDGYFYVAFGPNADCNVGEPVKIIAQKEMRYGETNSLVTYSPAKEQYDVLLKPLSETVTNTVQNNPSTIIFTTFGMILLILALVYLKRRNKLGHY